MPLTVIVEVEEVPVRPEGNDHVYFVALLTPVTETEPEPLDEQNAAEGIVPPAGVATIVIVPVTGVPVHVIPDATSTGVTVIV